MMLLYYYTLYSTQCVFISWYKKCLLFHTYQHPHQRRQFSQFTAHYLHVSMWNWVSLECSLVHECQQSFESWIIQILFNYLLIGFEQFGLYKFLGVALHTAAAAGSVSFLKTPGNGVTNAHLDRWDCTVHKLKPPCSRQIWKEIPQSLVQFELTRNNIVFPEPSFLSNFNVFYQGPSSRNILLFHDHLISLVAPSSCVEH